MRNRLILLSGQLPADCFCFSQAIAASENTAPARIQIIPMGRFTTQDERKISLELTSSAAKTIIDTFSAKSTDMLIDYEHNTRFSPPGTPNPAAGWIKDLSLSDDGLFADVEWTEKAAGMITAGEYRYVSPVVTKDKQGKITGLYEVALANKPAIDGMRPLITMSAENKSEEEIMLEVILKALGLSADASEADVLAKIAELTDGQNAPSEELLSQLGLEKGSTNAVVLAAVQGLVASKDQLVVLSERIDKMEADTAGKKAEELVALAQREGKVTPANAANMVAYAKKDYAAAEAFLKNAPVVVPMSQRTQTTSEDADVVVMLSANDEAFFTEIGVSKEDITKFGGKI